MISEFVVVDVVHVVAALVVLVVVALVSPHDLAAMAALVLGYVAGRGISRGRGPPLQPTTETDLLDPDTNQQKRGGGGR